MNEKDPKLTAIQFNEFINNRNIDGIVSLLTEEFTFLSINGKIEEVKALMTENWSSFFEEYPDYKNIVPRVESRDNFVIILRYSTCSYEPLDGPAIWTATIENDLVSKWQIYKDTEENRKMLNL